MTARTTAPSATKTRDMLSMLPSLIQQDIMIHCSSETTDKVYSARVLEVTGPRIRINLPRRVAGNGYLRTSRPVILVFVIDSQLYSCKAAYLADNNRTRDLHIEGDITKTSRRKHGRKPLQIHASYVPISPFSLGRGQYSNMKWKKCMTLDLSGGGVLFEIPFQAPVNSYLLINMEIPSFQGPFYVFGQVRWFGLKDARRKIYLCGIRFITCDELPSHFSDTTISALPEIMLHFDKNMQKELEECLKGQSGNRTQGDEDDD